MGTVSDYGVQLSQTTATSPALTAGTYQAGTVITANGHFSAIAVYPTIALAAGSTVTAVLMKLQAKRPDPGAQWFDLQTTRQSDGSTGTVMSWSPAANSSVSDSLETTSGFTLNGQLRVVVQTTGAPIAGDSVNCSIVVAED